MSTPGSFPGKAALTSAAFLLLLAACASINNERHTIIEQASKRGLTALPLQTDNFALLALLRQKNKTSKTLTIYLEGDGAAWLTAYQPPLDPTPQQGVALGLAAADPADKVAYLGRPCQYLDAAALSRCPSRYWNNARFAPEVIHAMDQALTQLKTAAAAERLQLVGFSGGGVIATLLAGQRRDVDRLITVAAPLALNDWLRWHNLTALPLARDPLQENAALPRAVHFAGGQDRIVPPAISQAFVARHGGRFERIEEFSHNCCWVRDWPQLLQKANAAPALSAP